MNPETSIAPSATAAADRTALKRLFLRAMIFALGACALVAVGALLLGEFTETTGKILATLGALAVHCGFAMLCAAALEKSLRPGLSRVGLAAGAIAFVVLVISIWSPGFWGEPTARAIGTSLATMLAYALALPSAALLGTHLRPLAAAGLFACAGALGMTLVCIWAEDASNEAFGKATLIAGIVAFSFAQTALLERLTGAARVGGWLRATEACIWTLALMLSISVATEFDDEWWFRWMGAVGVLDAAGSLAVLILARLRQTARTAHLETTPATLELRCPRCTTPQTVHSGVSACGACGLKFRIEVEEPRCAQCDYLLWQLPDRRCPECGTPF